MLHWEAVTRLPAALRYGTAVALVPLAVALRFALLPQDAGYAFLSFYPCIVVAALLLGTGPGLLNSALSLLAADYYFVPPYRTFSVDPAIVPAELIVVLTVAIVNLLAHELRRTSAALRESEQKLRGLFDTSPLGFVLNDLGSGRYLEYNAAFARITGYSAAELAGLTYWDLTPPEYHAAEAAALDALSEHGAYGPYQKEYVRKDGTRVPLLLRGQRLRLADGRDCIWSIVEDISERRRLEHAVLDAANREQVRLGHDLHDGVGQELTGLALLAAALATAVRRGHVASASELAEIETLARRAADGCRALSHGLAPLHYADGRLIPALEELVSLSAGAAVPVALTVVANAPLRLSASRAYNLYRIAQEAIANARRHAAAHHIRVVLEVDAEAVRLEVSDDGRGLGERPPQSTGIGLSIMRFRAEAMGAELAIGRGAAGGTQVVCRCPQEDPHRRPAARLSAA